MQRNEWVSLRNGRIVTISAISCFPMSARSSENPILSTNTYSHSNTSDIGRILSILSAMAKIFGRWYRALSGLVAVRSSLLWNAMKPHRRTVIQLILIFKHSKMDIYNITNPVLSIRKITQGFIQQKLHNCGLNLMVYG